ncbi:MAG TPA: trehalase-like domain-containing protein [Nitrososphaerales archaeon]|nr:trehalase-like domain-containing protein [Nitrososphaerales archaeon]
MARETQMEVPQKAQAYLPIEDHGVIGDLHTVALVGKTGTIDWWCSPAFDSPSIFGSILDAKIGGSFTIAPANIDQAQIRQYYLPETNVLTTRFLTPQGVAEVVDFMSIRRQKERTQSHAILRGARILSGFGSFKMVCRPAFNYARDRHNLNVTGKGAVFESTNISLGLSSSFPVENDGSGGAQARFKLNKGELAYFIAETGAKGRVDLHTEAGPIYWDKLYETVDYWRNWLQKCQYRGRWRETVLRSALTLKMLTYAPNRCNRRCPDDKPSRRNRRRAQLGLSIHLAKRFRFHSQQLVETWPL